MKPTIGERRFAPRGPYPRGRWLAIALAVALLMGVTAQPSVAAAPYDASKIDPALLSEVLADPKADYDVIVRTTSTATTASEREDRAGKAAKAVKRGGGKAKFALGIVGGAAATLSGKKALDLSRDRDVDYIFKDAKFRATFDPLLDSAKATTAGILAVNAPQAWTEFGVTGRGIGVAVVDSGVYAHPDLAGRIVAAIDFTNSYTTTTTTDPLTGATTTTTTYTAPTVSLTPLGDPGGHGTHVAGLIAGDGRSSGGTITGVAPNANIVDVRVINSKGSTSTSIVLQGMQWVLNNRVLYNIRVTNLSLGKPITSSYKLDPLATAAQVLTFAGITVVVSAGNSGSLGETITSPANDPYVIAVGAVDDYATAVRIDDQIASFSSRGKSTYDGISKPDLVAPGRKMPSLRSPGSTLDALYPERQITALGATTAEYFRMSGTSMAAPVVSGAIALMLERNPTLYPQIIKKRLSASALPLAGYDKQAQGAGMIDVRGAVASIDTSKEYSPHRVSDAFAKDMRRFIQGQPFHWRSLTFNGGVASNNITWENITWENITWDNITWENLTWENFTWENITWENITWENITWESAVVTLNVNVQWILID